MKNVHHALSAFPVALAVAPLLGMHHLLDIAPFALTMSGWATAPDLDCPGADPTHIDGPIGTALSRTVCRYSAWLYRHTRGPRDDPHNAGTHRHATHTPIHALALAAVATLSTLFGGAIAAVIWLALGIQFAAITLDNANRRQRLHFRRGHRIRHTVRWIRHHLVTLTALTLAGSWFIGAPLSGASILTVLAAHAPWIGAAVGLGCLTHLAGDAITHGGIPVFFPVSIGGARWRCYGALPRPLRFTAGGEFEQVIVAPLLVTGTVLLIPGAWPLVASCYTHVWFAALYLGHLA